MATLGIGVWDWDESSVADVRMLDFGTGEGCGRHASTGSDISLRSGAGNDGTAPSSAKSRLFSSYSQSSNESPGVDSSPAPHVALHLVSELLDDESIASLGDAASSSPDDDPAVSPVSSDHGFPRYCMYIMLESAVPAEHQYATLHVLVNSECDVSFDPYGALYIRIKLSQITQSDIDTATLLYM